MALDNENPPSPPKAAPQDNENPPTPPRAVPQDIETPPSPLEAVLQDNEKPPSPSKAAPQDSPKPTLIALDLVELYVIYVNHFLNTLFFGTVCLLLRPDTEFSLFWYT